MEFSSDRKQYSITDIYDKLQKSLPLVLKVRQGYSGDLLEKPLEKDQIIVLAVVSTQRRVVARLLSYIKPRILSLPTSLGETLCVMDDDGVTYGREGYIYTILREHRLPLEARLPPDQNIYFDHKHISTNDIPGFYFEKMFEEVNLLGNLIIDGKVDEDEILAVPLFLTELRVSLVSGIKGKKKQDWVEYQEKLRGICANVPYDFEYGSTQIAEYSHDNILYREEYARIEPKGYVKLQELVELAPPVPPIKDFEYKPPPAEEATAKVENFVDDDYEEIDIKPELMPKPFKNKKAPVDEPIPRVTPNKVGQNQDRVVKPDITNKYTYGAVNKRPPPSIPSTELPSTEEAQQLPRNKPIVNSPPIDANLPPSPQSFRPPLPNARENTKAYHSPQVKHAQKLAEEILLKTNQLSKSKPPVLAKPKLQFSSVSQDESSPIAQSSTTEGVYFPMQADVRRSKDGSNVIIDGQLQSAPVNKKSAPPPTASKPNVQRTQNRSSSENQTELTSNQNQSANTRISDVYVEVDVYENNPPNADDGYDYLVPSTPKQTANKPTKPEINIHTNTDEFGLKLYENNLPTQIVNPVKTEPKQQTTNSVVEDEKEKQKSENPQESQIKQSSTESEDKLTIDVADLSVKDVCEYLAKLNLEKYSDSFLVNMVDGEMLLKLDEEVLMGDLEMKKIEALRLIKFAKEGHLPKLRKQ